MNKKFLITLCAAVVLSACSNSGSRERASGDYDYVDTKGLDKGFQIPEELETPKISNRYDIPQLNSENADKPDKALIGRSVKVSSPRLVLPLVAGSHVEEGSEDATVLFDQIDDAAALDKTIWDKVLAYLEQNNIAVEKFDSDANELITGWVVSKTELDTSWYDFSSSYVEHAKKFKLSLEIAPHGRTAALTNQIIAYTNDNGEEALSSLDPISKRNNEVDFLNYIIAEYDFGLRLEQTRRIAKIRDGFNSELGFNANGDSAIVIDATYNDAWPRLMLVLRKMGFDVIDLDQSSGIMFVVYNGIEESWYSGFFSEDKLALEEDNYRIFVERAGDKAKVTFKDNENTTFTPKQLSDIFPVFKEYMASDNLDI